VSRCIVENVSKTIIHHPNSQELDDNHIILIGGLVKILNL